jgi:hypothetical protein
MNAEIERIEREYGQRVVAIVYDSDGSIHDHCFTWETGQSFALGGYVVEAIAVDNYMGIEEAQGLYDAELERHNDCFGERV